MSGSSDSSYWQGTSADAQMAQASKAMSGQHGDAMPAILQKDHVVAALLAFFLGMFGIHKFYLGYYQTAFIMMAVSIVGGIVSFGLALVAVWIVAIVEGAIYASCTQTTFEEAYVINRKDWF